MIEFYDRPFVEASEAELNIMIVEILTDIEVDNNIMWTDVSDKNVELFEELMYERILRN